MKQSYTATELAACHDRAVHRLPMTDWSPAAWAAELRQKAARCDARHQDVARRWREWADELSRNA